MWLPQGGGNKKMPSINMIATRRAEKNKLEEKVRIGLILVSGSVLIALVILIFMSARVYSIKRDISDVDVELQKTQPIILQITQYEAAIKDLTPKLALLIESKQKTMQNYDLLIYIGKALADKTWITGLSTTQSTTGNAQGQVNGNGTESTLLNLKGLSASQSLIGETMMRLGQVPMFDSVDLEYTQGNNSPDNLMFEFSINIKMKDITNGKEEASGNANH
jgi:Tfp pilus assembly protein PilN